MHEHCLNSLSAPIGWKSYFYVVTDVHLPNGGRLVGSPLTEDVGSRAAAREAAERLRDTYPHVYVMEHQVRTTEEPQQPMQIDPGVTIPRRSEAA